MPNVAAVLKLEIARIARKEIKASLSPLRKGTVQMRKALAAVKRRLAATERAMTGLSRQLAKTPSLEGAAIAQADTSEPRARFTLKGLRSLQRRLRLTGPEFARLLGISSQAVYAWRRQQGAIRLRKATREAVLQLRQMGAREARRRLEALGPAPRRRRVRSSRRKP